MSDPLARYHRQMLLPRIGRAGQEQLASARVLLVGCGALGTVIADALVRAGVGNLTIVDRDVVELTNLQRQVLFDERDAAEGTPKAVAAAKRLLQINSGIALHPLVADFTPRFASQLAGDAFSVIVDGTDNFQTRYLLNDLCVSRGIPFIYGGAVGTAGMTMTVLPKTTPCLRCVFPEPPPPGMTATCDTAGVLGPAVGIIANMQAAEAIKILVGQVDSCVRGLREIDAWNGRMRTIELGPPVADCICCGLRNFEYLNSGAGDGTAALCGADAVQVAAESASLVDLAGLAARLNQHGQFTFTTHLLRGRFFHEKDRATGKPIELTVFRDSRAIVKGTTDPALARTIYARYVGA